MTGAPGGSSGTERDGQAYVLALVFAAHMDTVFPEGTDLTVKRDGTRRNRVACRCRLHRESVLTEL
jgi:hypothetical protein